MNYPIVRMFETAEDAAAAVQELRAWGVAPDAIHRVTPDAASAPGADDPVLAAVLQCFVLRADAVIYAARIRQGRSLVSVHAPLGFGLQATRILESHHPVDSGVPEEKAPLRDWDEGAPLSSALWLPVLSRGATPFSKFWSLPVLVRSGRTLGAALGLPEVGGSSAPTTESLGLPMLSANPTPLSSLLRLPVLRK